MFVKKLALAAGLTALIQLSAVAQTATTTPAKPATTAPAATSTTTAPAAGTAAKPAAEHEHHIVKSTTVVVNINTATEDELQQVKGIGKSHATAIIKNRPYKATNELVSKKVISQKEFDELKAQFKL